MVFGFLLFNFKTASLFLSNLYDGHNVRAVFLNINFFFHSECCDFKIIKYMYVWLQAPFILLDYRSRVRICDESQHGRETATFNHR